MNSSNDSPPPVSEGIDRTFWPATGMLAAIVLVCAFTPVDLWIQDKCFDFTRARWLVDTSSQVPRFIFHQLPTVFVIGVGAALTVFLIATVYRGGRSPWTTASPRAVVCALLCIVLLPALISASKQITNKFCPSEMRRYGGDVCYVGLLARFPANDRPTRKGRCFPAAHASCGFSLMGLYELAQRRRTRITIIFGALLVGWVAGLYQILSGAHFVSHTLVTMVVAWLVFLMCRRLVVMHSRS